MPRRLIVRLRRRLDASPLPLLDSVRLQLEAELDDVVAAAATPPAPRRFLALLDLNDRRPRAAYRG